MPLKLLKTVEDKQNGRITVDCQIVERAGTDVKTGAVETHSIDPTMLQVMYGGDVMAWLRATHEPMVQRHEIRKMTGIDLVALQGKEIDFESEDSK